VVESAATEGQPERRVGIRRLVRVAAVLLGLYALWTLCINIPGVANDGAVAHSFAYQTDSLDTACSVEVDAKRLCTVTWPASDGTTSAVYAVERTGRCWRAVLHQEPLALVNWPASRRQCVVLSDNLRPWERAFGDHKVGMSRDDSRFAKG